MPKGCALSIEGFLYCPLNLRFTCSWLGEPWSLAFSASGSGDCTQTDAK